MTWIKYIGGKLEGRYRYSTSLYNNFPFPSINNSNKDKIEKCVQNILDIREKYNMTLFELYDPKTMPYDLKKAHKKLDKQVEKLYASDNLYKKGTFEDELSCLTFLLKLYEKI